MATQMSNQQYSSVHCHGLKDAMLCLKIHTVLENGVAMLRPYIGRFARKLTGKDKRRIQKNKALKKFQTVRKTINKKTGKQQVTLALQVMVRLLVKYVERCVWGFEIIHRSSAV